MAPKQAENIVKNLPMASSSEEEEEESGSLSGEEESEKEDSHVTPVALKNPEANSEEESSDTCGEESQKEKSHFTHISLKNPEANSEETEPSKKRRKRQNTHVTKDKPESSVAKRSLDNAKVQKNNKKLKTKIFEHDEATTKEEDKKTPLFKRIFSHVDELALLRGILRFTSKKGNPYEDTDRFCAKVKRRMSFDASKNQLITKIQRLKSKFEKNVRQCLVKGPIVFSKIVDEEIFDLSKKIWGNEGVLASKAMKKLGGNPTYEEIKQETTNVVSTSLSCGNEILSFLKKENVVSFSLDESSVMARWDMVKDGRKKKTMEEKVKTVNATHVEICSERIQFVANIANMLLSDISSSSSK